MQRHGIGVDAPEVVTAGREFAVIVLGVSSPAEIVVRIVEVDSGRRFFVAPVRRTGVAELTAGVRLDAPGLFRIEVSDGRYPVERLLLVVPDAEE
ncbi:hypothetical protein L3i22_038790 [Actinoplanes sp. L3-i22]|nr:hypothetical protein L3i22_038790 [Actinoplanes sp. L3-i22]